MHANRTPLFLPVLLVLLVYGSAIGAATYTISNGPLQGYPVDPYFLDPGDDVVDFYSYGSPVGSSANTGFEQLNTALVYLTLDDAGQYGLVAICDRWGGGGGSATLLVSGFPDGASRAVSDDSGEVGPVTAAHTSSCDWSWLNCCTDGGAWRLGAGDSFTLQLDWTFESSIDTLRFISFDPCAQDELLFIDLDPGEPLVITSQHVDGELPDCNGNNQPDFCDLLSGFSQDCDSSGVPDECEADCNGNGLHDSCDLATGFSQDCDGSGVPDECEADCNGNGLHDSCDLASGSSQDCNQNLLPDECDIVGGFSLDLNGNGVPDECEPTVGALEQPGNFSLSPAVPNPFNPVTRLAYRLPATMAHRLCVVDVRGREVAVLRDGLGEAGAHELVFHAAGLPSGLYLVVLETEQGRLSEKLLLMK